MQNTCSIEGCSKKAKARGWCDAHWFRWRHHGNPLGGGPTPGWATKFLRETVIPYQGDECLIWPYARNNVGYAQIGSGRKIVLATRIVCEERYGPPPSDSHDAAHSCGNGHLGCVNGKHLSWKTHAENQAEMVDHGNSSRGEKAWSSKLTEQQVREIKLLKGVEYQIDTAKRFGVTRSAISAIQVGRSWGWLNEQN